MTQRLHPVVFAAVIAATLSASTIEVRAEVNRVLPFWAQPYPTGYARIEAGYEPATSHCQVLRRLHTRHGLQTVVKDRCGPVLHARD